ncbi:MAG: pyruvate kinase [Actinomycetota bacterium]|nr:pyruvate kinase [Actinomycetota bacterium]MDA3002097.1 pyruvate kinase [Actinomycetota bacterium]
MRRTKIVATLGPSSQHRVAELVAAGVAIVRINCSHLTTDEVADAVRSARSQSATVGILVDVQGPKLRLIDGVDARGAEVTLHERGHGHGPMVGFDPAAVGVEPGERILVNDGRIVLRAVEVRPHMVRAEVVVPGVAEGKRGVNLPDTNVNMRMFSEKDQADIAAAVESGADWIALSFVQRAEDVLEARRMVPDDIRILAKIERPQALRVLGEICGVADGVMAARGDLGVEIPFARLPVAQRAIADASLRSGAMSICATEMLESMTSSTRPTRAEVSDVANAVRDGFDCVMLSAETAIGHDPVGAVRAMAQILEEADSLDGFVSPFADHNPNAAAVAASAASLASRLKARAILAITYTGHNAELLSACRPNVPIIAATEDPRVVTRLMARFGVKPVLAERPDSTDESIDYAIAAAVAAGHLTRGDLIIVAMSRISPRSDTDTIFVHRV